MNISITPVHEAEAVIARFFDPLREHVELWKREVTPDRPGNAIRGSRHAVQCEWVQGEPVRARMWRDVDLDVYDFTHLSLCFQSSSSTVVTVRAVVDGQERAVIDRAAGTDASQELEHR